MNSTIRWRYKVQQHKGRYALKLCDDGDVVDYAEAKRCIYLAEAALRTEREGREKAERGWQRVCQHEWSALRQHRHHCLKGCGASYATEAEFAAHSTGGWGAMSAIKRYAAMYQPQDNAESIPATVVLASDHDAAIQAAEKARDVWERDARTAKACWDAACNDTAALEGKLTRATDLLREVDEYLKPSPLNYICSGSVLHKRIAALLQPAWEQQA